MRFSGFEFVSLSGRRGDILIASFLSLKENKVSFWGNSVHWIMLKNKQITFLLKRNQLVSIRASFVGHIALF